jgi:hypothetical protein
VTNQQRRNALNAARSHALRHATAAEEHDPDIDLSTWSKHARLAEMWASVANAMKDGNPSHDGPDGRPSALLSTEHGVITR